MSIFCQFHCQHFLSVETVEILNENTSLHKIINIFADSLIEGGKWSEWH